MTNLTDLTLVEQIDGIKSNKFTSLELTQAHLKKIKDNADLNAFITICEETAIEAAKQSDSTKDKTAMKLCGVPIAIKDMILTEGIETTAGSSILKGFIPPYSATVTKKLNAAGSIMIGKTNMDEFAMGSSTESSFCGAAKNPWNKEYVPGGSSGGSAVVVASKLSAAALGTDTGGSVRQPSSYCGISGIKPTYGRISRYGVIAYASSLDQVGVFARTVKDCALVLENIAGHDPLDSTSYNAPCQNFYGDLTTNIKGLRIGIPKEYFIEGLNNEVASAVQSAISQLQKLGVTLVDISLPHTKYAVPAYYIIALAEASSNLARYDGIRYGHRTTEKTNLFNLYTRSRSEGFGKEVKRRIAIGSYVLSSGYQDAYYVRAQKVRALISRDFVEAFSNKCDVIACPTAPTTAFKIGEKTTNPVEMYLNDIFTVPVNLAGLPGLSVPCGFDSAGLPVGLHLIGKHWDEQTILNVAHSYEASSDWHKKLPVTK